MLDQKTALDLTSRSNARIKNKLLISLLASTSLALNTAAFAGALPTGASVAAGKVKVSTSGSAMTVTQDTNKAIVNWNAFSIGQNNSVEFVQPDSSSAILNRVTGTTTSSIAGSLSANGQVYLINPNGIAITSTGTVKVGGGFVASTLDISDDDFLNGNMNFNGDGASAGVTNDGIITIGRGGYAALMGGTVKNDGLIAVPIGSIGLGSGEQVTLDLSGDGFMQVAVPTEDGAEGDGALVENSGTLSANGGTVVMKAATARNTARQAINMDGLVEANTVSGSDGAITFGGGAGGTVKVSGTVKATAKSGTGGSVEITGDKVSLANATIDASGAAGGGSVKIGGDWHGDGDLQTASTTTIDADTVISADATLDGDGGEVVVWSNDLTTFAGTISALGSGDGGDAEVSGKALLDYQGFADLSSENGAYGTLLLDPYNITITDDESAGTSLTASEDDSTLSVTTLESALSSADVVVSTGSEGTQEGNITVASEVSWSADTRLTLNAENNIYINADITATGESASLSMNYGGDYSIGTGASITLSGSSALLYLKGTLYTLIHSLEELDNIDNTGLDLNYALAEDLDASEETYSEALIGNDIYDSFTGTFAGLGHTISNLTISASGKYGVGLFSSANGATIRDIGLVGGTISGYQYVGGLVGRVTGGTITNSYATTTILGSRQYIGGLTGYIAEGTITDSYATGDVTGSSSNVGGLVGLSDESSISNSYATGNVSGSSSIGGLVGDNNASTISNSYATGTVTATSVSSGGLVGSQNAGVITNSYATGDVTGTNYIGGLVGFSTSLTVDGEITYGSITNSYATGDVTGSYDVGGLIGYDSHTPISYSYATGDVTGPENVGGLIGGIYGDHAIISYTYATGDVSGTENVGGLVGYGYYFSTISYSYASGAVTGTTNVGGLGGEFTRITLNNSYWDTETTGQSSAIGDETITDVTNTSGLTTAEARNSSSYSGWDFTDTWYQTGNMRPILRSEAAEASDGVITIANLHQMALIDLDLTADYVLTADIDASETGEGDSSSSVWGSEGFVYLGTSSSEAFSGSFDGDGHTISNLTINAGSNSYVGLFGYSTGTITNIGLIDSYVEGSYYVGALAGYSTGDISNSYATGSVTGEGNVGGLVGGMENADISKSYADMTVNASDSTAGGLVGLYINGTISESYASGDVTSDYEVGGLVGSTDDLTIINSYASGSVTATDYDGYAGGLVGTFADGSVIQYSYAVGAVSNTTSSSNAGGLVGILSGGTIRESFWDKETTGQSSSNGSYAYGSILSVSGLTTSDFQNTASFMTRAPGWDFDTVWAPSSDGYYPELYALTPVVWVSEISSVGIYGNSTGTGSVKTSTGGSDSYVFDDEYDSLIFDSYEVSIDSTASVGTTETTLTTENSTAESTNGITYRVFYYGSTEETITARAITITADDLDRVYGDDNGTLTYTVGGLGLVNNDTLSGALTTTADGASDVGDYTITQGTLDASSNYSVSYTAGTLKITPRAITITADDLERAYGDDNGTLTYTVGGSGLANGDTLSGSLTTTADSASDVGDYTISQGSLDASSNYSVSYKAGTLTITPRAITITAVDLERAYGDDNDELTYTVGGSGLANGDTLSGALATSADSASDVGDYTISQGTLDASSNYSVSYNAGTLTITPRAITITADDLERTYGDDNGTLTYTVGGSGLANGDTLSGALATSADSASDVGTYAISQGTLDASSNYSVSYKAGTLTITPRAITITADDLERAYGDDNGTLTYTVGGSGLANGDTLSGALATSADSTSDVGTYAISQGTLDASSNYVVTYYKGTLTVVASSGGGTGSGSNSGNENNQDNGGSEETTIVEIPPMAGLISNIGTTTYSSFSKKGVFSPLDGNSEGEEQGTGSDSSQTSGYIPEANNDEALEGNTVCLLSAGCSTN